MSRFLGGLVERMVKLGLALVVATLLSPSLHAQLVRGSVSGTVTDPQNVAVTGATITLTDQEKGVVQTTTTNDSGFYRLSGVDPGRYSVQFTKEGFETQKSGGIEVRSGKDTTVDAPLRLGAVSSQVFVTVPGMELDKTAPSVRLNLPGRVLDEIPLGTSSLVPGGARNFARYALFTPGVVRVLYQNETSANGHRGRENNYMVDGVDNNDQTATLPALFIPPEAIQEVDVQAATFSAEYGRSIGAQINVVTKSGTNSYRGELWEFYRGNALEPMSLTSRIAGLQNSPRLVDNQFGGAFGGPILRGKTFFFGMVQGNLQRTGPRPQSAVTIPTPAGYAALASVPLRSSPTAQSPESRQAALDALSFLPEVHNAVQNYESTSTILVNGTSVEMGTFRPVIPTYQNVWNTTMRVDHDFRSTDRLTYRGHVDRRVSPLSTGNLRFGDRFGTDSKWFAQNHFLGYTKTIGTRWVNEARVSYARLYPSFVERDPVTPTSSITGAFQIGSNANFPDQRLERTFQVQNVSTYILSRHSLKFGLDLSRTNLEGNTAPNARGTWSFPNFASFLNSQPTSLTYLATPGGRYQFAQLRQAYFVQDDFKVTRNFTANLGLRYETSSIPLGFFGSTLPEVLNAVGQGPVQPDKNNWGPRVGFAYSPDFRSGFLGTVFGSGKSAIRGGFGVGYDQLFYSLPAQVATQSYPWAVSPQLLNAAAMDLFPTLPPATLTLTSTTTLVNIIPDAQNPTSHYWSLSVQRQLRSNYMLELGYNGNRSYHLIRQGQANFGVLPEAKAAAVIAGCTSANLGTCQDPVGFANSPTRLNTSWGSRILLETTGTGEYHGMYVQFNGRMPFGLRVGVNYTWSANFSDSDEFSNDSAGSSSAGILDSTSPQPQNFNNRRNEWSRSAFDRPHRFTVNYTYEIPGFRSSNAIVNQAVNGWQLSGFTELQSGQPFTIRLGTDALGSGASATSLPARPDYNPGGIMLMDPATNNLRTFSIPLDGTGIVTAPHVTSPTGVITFLKNSMPLGGTLGRNTFRGPGFANFNMSIAKRFSLPGDRQLQLRGDFMNVFNHDNFPNPDGIMSNGGVVNANFGKQKFQPLTDARQVLLGVKLSF